MSNPLETTVSESVTNAAAIAANNPLRYRGYVYDTETGLYYLQSRYYNPEIGRFINADALVSTGQGLLGNNMFTYCRNNPITRYDPAGSSFSSAFAMTCVDPGKGARYDYVIYYFHAQSSANLDRSAVLNHPASETYFSSVSTFSEMAQAINSVPEYADDVFIYVHGDEDELSFYFAQYYSAEDIKNSINELDISGSIYLFSCKGGRGALASAMASATDCTVIASVYKVSFDIGLARCGWKNYFEDYHNEGTIAWYSFFPDGTKEPYSQYYIYTR